MVSFYTSGTRKTEVHRFRLPTLLLVPILTLVLQNYLPLYFPSVSVLDLPLLVVVYYALARGNPVAGMLGGALLGMGQDSLTGGPIGLLGAVKTVIGFLTSLASLRLDTESVGIRFITIFIAYYLHVILLYFLASVLLGLAIPMQWRTRVVAALVNAVVGVLLFRLLDRFREPA
ncbi:MAG: rod shape-determining protein MreD [Acidobacteria bacterium]|nr:rod shape-determining protein MreD [Acidobacteriota bacterium]